MTGARRQRSASEAKTPPVPATHAQLSLRSEGQRMLLHVTGSLAAIAAEIGATSAQSVLDWRNGTRQPSAPARARMYAALGIPVAAWLHKPQGHELQTRQANPPPPPERAPGTSLEDCMRLLAQIQRDASAPNLLPAERVKLVDTEARILKLRAELEARAELSESRYVAEHPAWLRARNVLSQALKPYPDAARAVADALETLGL